MELYPDSPGDLYDAACGMARTAAAAKPGEEARRRYGDRAVAVLRRAVAAGFHEAERARKDPALEALRERDDFRKLLADMERK
jgi:mannose/cellobiose epimerase-like protein (N-acyl-D-glucosamine 2-epimerase family)